MVQAEIAKLLVITGPTAVGKSELAVEAAIKYNGEVISADSMQIYKGMDIGTGKVTSAEMRGIDHYMLDLVTPEEDYSVGRYVIEAKNAINNVLKKGKLPILCGGTGLYINSLLCNHSFAGAPKNEVVREELKNFVAQNGGDALYEELSRIDPLSATQINRNDVKRLIRAMEIFRITGKPRGEFKDESKSDFDYTLFVVYDEREKLYDRINNRVDKMIKCGLIDEVNGLYKYKDCNSMQAIGYKEIVSYLDGNISLNDAVELVKQSSRRYAKRQMTFFRGMKSRKSFVNVSENVLKVIGETFKNID